MVVTRDVEISVIVATCVICGLAGRVVEVKIVDSVTVCSWVIVAGAGAVLVKLTVLVKHGLSVGQPATVGVAMISVVEVVETIVLVAMGAETIVVDKEPVYC